MKLFRILLGLLKQNTTIISLIIQECRSYRFDRRTCGRRTFCQTIKMYSVYAEFRAASQHDGYEGIETYIALEQIQDPANLGSVLRTAEALGVSGVLFLGDCCDIYSPKALRSSMGAIFRLPFYIEKRYVLAIKELKEKHLLCLRQFLLNRRKAF